MTYFEFLAIALALLAGALFSAAERYLKQRIKSLATLLGDRIKDHEKAVACRPRDASYVGHAEKMAFQNGCVYALEGAVKAINLFIEYSGGGFDTKVNIKISGNPVINWFKTWRMRRILKRINPDRLQDGFREWAKEKGYIRDTTATDKEVWVKGDSRLELSTEV